MFRGLFDPPLERELEIFSPKDGEDLPWEGRPYRDFSRHFDQGIQETFKQVLIEALKQVVEDEPEVEFFEEENKTLTVKIRGRWNDWLQGISFEYIPPILQRLRTLLNAKGFKQCRVQCSIHEKDSEKSNIRIIYNPKWRRYENYEIFFRNKTQSHRKITPRRV